MTRKAIPENIKRRLYAESMGKCMNPDCQTDLFLGLGDIIEKAHIIPYANTADNSFENLILLCPNCHTKFDKNSAFNAKKVKTWKRKRNEKVSKVFASLDDNLYKQDMNSVQILMNYMPFIHIPGIIEELPYSVSIKYTEPLDVYYGFIKGNPHLYPFNDNILTTHFNNFINILSNLHDILSGSTSTRSDGKYELITQNMMINGQIGNLNQCFSNYSAADMTSKIHINKKFIQYEALEFLINEIENRKKDLLYSYSKLIGYLRSNYKSVNLNSYTPYTFD